MANAAQIREQIEADLAKRQGGQMRLAPRLVAPGYATGFPGLDAVLPDGFPIVGISEIIGGQSSGKATIASAYVANHTKAGRVCAWINVAGDMNPEAVASDGGDLDRVFWIRCHDVEIEPCARAMEPDIHKSTRETTTREKTTATSGWPDRTFQRERTEQLNSDRQPARRGARVAKPAQAFRKGPQQAQACVSRQPFTSAKNPWKRLEQAILSVDLLAQGGGFSVIVLDFGNVAPEFTRRIPLATWFRWRAALVRTGGSLLVLSQIGLTGSSSELILQVEVEVPPRSTVLSVFSHHLKIVRRRFAEEAVTSQRKGPERVSVWQSCTEFAHQEVAG